MIVVIGSPRLRGSGPEAEAAGLAVSIAAAAAAAGASVELIGKLGDDPAGDAVLIDLAGRRVGHVAMLRDPGRPTRVVQGDVVDAPDAPPADAPAAADDTDSVEGPVLDAADAGLALRYLPEIGVIVAVHVGPDVLGEASSAAGWAETALVVVVPADAADPAGLPPGAVTVALDDGDDSVAGAAIGRYVAALDRGEPAEGAYGSLIAAVRG